MSSKQRPNKASSFLRMGSLRSRRSWTLWRLKRISLRLEKEQLRLQNLLALIDLQHLQIKLLEEEQELLTHHLQEQQEILRYRILQQSPPELPMPELEQELLSR